MSKGNHGARLRDTHPQTTDYASAAAACTVSYSTHSVLDSGLQVMFPKWFFNYHRIHTSVAVGLSVSGYIGLNRYSW